MTIDVRDLRVDLGGARVLDGVTARAAAGAITVIIGPNAAGKSTLLRAIVGALPAASGSVAVGERDPRGLRGRALAARIAYVPQRPLVAAPFSVREVVALGRYALGAAPERVDDALARLDLADVAERPYAALSVGQQQRVTFARALAQVGAGGALVLDEPTSAMDLRHARACFDVLREEAKRGATVVAAVHDLRAAADGADDVWLLDAGRLVAAGPARDVCTPERLEAVFGLPFRRWTTDDGRVVFLP